jgi:hypothetical protein
MNVTVWELVTMCYVVLTGKDDKALTFDFVSSCYPQPERYTSYMPCNVWISLVKDLQIWEREH